jgi:MFS family permease
MADRIPTSTVEQPWPSPRYANYVLAVLAISYVFAFLDRIIVGMLTPDIIKNLNISDTQAGLLQGLAFALFYTLFGIPLGWLADRANRQRILSIGMTVWSVMTAACGLPTTFWPLFAARVGVGVGEATLNPCASSLIADYFPPKERAKAFGFYTMATAFASIITYLISSFLLQALKEYESAPSPFLGLYRWQLVFVLVGLLGLIPTIVFALTVREPVRRGVTAAVQTTWAETLVFLRANARTFFCLMLGASLVILEVYATAYWQITFFLRVYEWSPVKTGIVIALFQSTCGIVSAYTSGYVTNWFKQRGYPDGVWMTLLIGAVGCTLFGTLATIMPTPELAVFMFMLKSFTVNYAPAAALTGMAEVTPNQHRGQIVALYVIMTGLFAQGLGPFLVGVTTDFYFQDPKAVGKSISLLVSTTGIVGIALLIWGRAAYRRSLSAVTWEQPAVAAH